MTDFKRVVHDVDFCVVGGGMAGLCAAIAAARHGATVVLMHDRPVFGGNASSECRVHICGADRHNTIKNLRETGLLEEIRMENLARNPNRNFSTWDLILYETVLAEPNIRALLNCSCLGADMPRAFRIDGLRGRKWEALICEDRNHQRLRRFSLPAGLRGVRFRLDATWGAESSRLYAFYVD
jgi:hypothetical protein